MAGVIQSASYAMGQGLRVAWFAGNHILARRMGRAADGDERQPIKTSHPVPPRGAMLASMRALFEADWANIQSGLYRAPEALEDGPLTLLGRARDFLSDVADVDRRRRMGGHSEVLTEARRQRYPRYYLQNFHFQTDGWFSEASARRYDYQVETLFAGTADAMRRQVLAPLARFLKGRDQRQVHLADVACGTGRFLRQVKGNWPLLRVTGLDLSPAYVRQAAASLAPWRHVSTVEANAEAMPFASGSVDAVTCIYLFHELPPKVRETVAAEIARILKPGGVFVFADSVQPRDNPDFAALMEMFPQAFHEPFYGSYLDWDARAAFGAHGLSQFEDQLAFLTTVRVFKRD